MSIPVLVAKKGGRPTALLGLGSVLAGVLVAAILATILLLRHDAPGDAVVVRPVQPVPYRLLLMDGGKLWAISNSGRRRLAAPFPSLGATAIRRVVPAPDGGHVLLITGSADAQQAWLWAAPRQAPVRIVDPALPTTAQRYLAAVWSDSQTLHLLVAHGARAWTMQLSVASGVPALERSVVVHVPAGEILSLSPNGHQVALAVTRPGDGTFGPQEAIKVQHLVLPLSSVAYQYLGNRLPNAVLWSSDDGTVAVVRAGDGIALERASGSTVLAAPHGVLPAAFSHENAQFAYTTLYNKEWRIHVVSLHSEVDHIVGPAFRDAPSDLYWTPDDRVLVLRIGSVLWQLDPSTGILQQVARGARGAIVGVTPAGGLFGQ